MTFSLCLQYSFNIDVDLSSSRAQMDSLNNGSWKLCLSLNFVFLFVSISLQAQGTVFCVFYVFFNDALAKERVHLLSEMHMSNVELCMELLHLGMSSCFLSIKYFTWTYPSLIIWKKNGLVELSWNWQMFSFAEPQKYARFECLLHYYGFLESGKLVNTENSKLEKNKLKWLYLQVIKLHE